MTPPAAAARLAIPFVVSAAIYTTLGWLGPRYALDTPPDERPLLTVIGLYLAASAVYLWALREVCRTPLRRGLAAWVFGTSLALRALMLPTPPFQEIDIYRYLWDGAAVARGVDPYAFPPGTVVAALDRGVDPATDADLARLVAAASDDPELERILRTIHYAELPSPYPPVSQAVFAAAALTTPSGATAETRLRWLKAVLTAFDLATLAMVMGLVRVSGLPIGAAIAYGWCPLVLKEFAGSGHLDAVAVFFTTAALAAFVGAFRRSRSSGSFAMAVLGAALLAFGVGSKLYPVVLAPLVAAACWRRLGPTRAALAALVFLAVSAATLAPMLWPRADSSPATSAASPASEAVSLPPPPGAAPAAAPAKTAGLAAFLQRWEMNDLLFMLVYDNARWHDPDAPSRHPWFDVTPAAWSAPFRGRGSEVFLATRAATSLVFLAIALAVAWRASRSEHDEPIDTAAWLNAALVTLAWFWLLSPTQNPWYWCWAVPLLPFARRRAWLAVSFVAFGYYLRFWLEAHFPTPGVAGTPYDGAYFFYYVVPWLEFGPILAWLALETLLDPRARRAGLWWGPQTALPGRS